MPQSTPGRTNTLLGLVLLVLSFVSAQLISGLSRFGRFGVSWMYREYSFLKVWWQVWLFVLALWLLLWGVHSLLSRTLRGMPLVVAHVVGLLSAILGLYLSFQNFRADLTHRWLGARFHAGVYIFWLGWVLIALFYLFRRRRSREEIKIAKQQ